MSRSVRLALYRFRPLLLTLAGCLLCVVGLLCLRPHEHTAVVVAADLPAGHTLTLQDLRTAEVGSTGAEEIGLYSSPAELVGKRLGSGLTEGEAVSRTSLDLERRLSPTAHEAALAVTVPEPEARLLQAGDDVLVQDTAERSAAPVRGRVLKEMPSEPKQASGALASSAGRTMTYMIAVPEAEAIRLLPGQRKGTLGLLVHGSAQRR